MGLLYLVHRHSLVESHTGIRSKITYIKKLKIPHSELHTLEEIKYLLLILIEIQIEACSNRHVRRAINTAIKIYHWVGFIDYSFFYRALACIVQICRGNFWCHQLRGFLAQVSCKSTVFFLARRLCAEFQLLFPLLLLLVYWMQYNAVEDVAESYLTSEVPMRTRLILFAESCKNCWCRSWIKRWESSSYSLLHRVRISKVGGFSLYMWAKLSSSFSLPILCDEGYSRFWDLKNPTTRHTGSSAA